MYKRDGNKCWNVSTISILADVHHIWMRWEFEATNAQEFQQQRLNYDSSQTLLLELCWGKACDLFSIKLISEELNTEVPKQFKNISNVMRF